MGCMVIVTDLTIQHESTANVTDLTFQHARTGDVAVARQLVLMTFVDERIKSILNHVLSEAQVAVDVERVDLLSYHNGEFISQNRAVVLKCYLG